MDALYTDQVAFGDKGSLRQSVDQAQHTLELLENARSAIFESGTSNTAFTLAKLQTPVKQSLDVINSNLKDVHKASTLYSKALDKRLKAKPATATEENQLSSDTLLDRAIGMHLLREGQFGVATAFLEEMPESANSTSMDADDGSGTPISLKTRFEHMYYILEEMRSNRNLDPAMEWARARRGQLQARGSDLEFELTKLQFIWLFAGRADSPVTQRLMAATRYAREALSRFEGRYLRDIEQLVGSLAFSSGLDSSPYRSVFEGSGAWDEVALTFTREFCSLLGLSADSPLFVATTAGAMALPRLDKLHTIMKEKRTEWTTAHELPVEIPLPPTYRFHSIFVCPVSKEQATDSNPPMLLPCCHVIAQESLARISKMGKYKCPYCPTESLYTHAKRVFL